MKPKIEAPKKPPFNPDFYIHVNSWVMGASHKKIKLTGEKYFSHVGQPGCLDRYVDILPTSSGTNHIDNH